MINVKKISAFALGLSLCANVSFAKDIVILIDYSNSISNEDWKIYDTMVSQTFKSLEVNDRISLMPIGTNSQGSTQAFGSVTLEDKGHAVKSKNYNFPRLKKLLDIYKEKKSTMANKENRTLIVSSLRAAGEYLNSSKDPKKTIIVLSDMDDSSKEFPMSQLKSGQCSSSDAIVKKANNKPMLSRINIIVRGASAKNDQGYACMKNFWSTYFKASGAATVDYSRQ